MRIMFADLEGNGLLDEITTIHCFVAKDKDSGEVYEFTPTTLSGLPAFLDTVDELIMHNGIGFDLPALRKIIGYDYKGKLTDTLIISKTLQPDRPIPLNCPNKRAPHSLEVWGYRVGRGKPEHNDWANYSPAMLHRCKEDVEITQLVYDELMEEAHPGWWNSTYRPMDMTHQLFTILQKQEEYGWLFDIPHAERCIQQLTDIMDSIAGFLQPRLPLRTFSFEKKVDADEKYDMPLRQLNLHVSGFSDYTYVRTPFLKSGKLNTHVQKFISVHGHIPRIVGPHSRVMFRPVDIESPDELKTLLLSLGWKPKEWNLKNGKPTSPKLSKDDPFEGLKGGIGKMIAKRIQCKHRRSNIEGWLKEVDENGRIHGGVAGLANTGRAKHRVIVNVPGGDSFFGKKMRQCFTVPKGKLLVGVDSAGCQNRMLAARVNDPFFTKTLLEGKKEEGTSIHHVNQQAIKKVAGIDVTYHQAKTLNYAALFGASHKKLGYGNAALGEKIQAAIFGVAPGFQKLVDDLKAEWKQNAKMRINRWNKPEWYNGYVIGLDGRPIYIESEHAILVYMLQSDEAITMSMAYCKLFSEASKRFGPFGKRWAIVGWQHDEFQVEVDESIATHFAKVAESCIEWAGRWYAIKCPHKGESNLGRNWYETH